MNHDEVSTFLAIVEHGNMSAASAALHISQGTASTRIRGLEQELGVQLLHRARGMRSVTLTPEGETFLPIAQQWSALREEAAQLRDLPLSRDLRIAAPDVLNQNLLGEVYRGFLDDHPDTRLFVQTEHSSETHQLVENQLIDVGFAFALHTFPNVIATPLYREGMVFAFHAGSRFDDSRDTADLDVRHEVYLRWSAEFNLWHDRFFAHERRPRITLGTVSMLPQFLDDPDSWGIVTASVAHMLSRRIPGLVFESIADPPPQRRAYVLRNRHPKPWMRHAVGDFLDVVRRRVDAEDTLTLEKQSAHI